MFSLLDTRTKRTIKKMVKIKVYTAITDNKDEQRNDVLCFIEGKGIMGAKIYKVLPHVFLDTEWSIWIDGNITLKISPEELVAMVKGDIGVFPHPWRKTLFEEGNYCIENKIGETDIIRKQLQRYANAKETMGELAMCGILVRKHTPEMKQLCEGWWEEIKRGSVRDQISFPYIFKKPYFFPFQGDIRNNKFFSRKTHKK